MTAALLGYRRLGVAAEQDERHAGRARAACDETVRSGELSRMTVAQLMDRLGRSEHARQCFSYHCRSRRLTTARGVVGAVVGRSSQAGVFLAPPRFSIRLFACRPGRTLLHGRETVGSSARAVSVVSHWIVEMLGLGAGGRVASVRLPRRQQSRHQDFISARSLRRSCFACCRKRRRRSIFRAFRGFFEFTNYLRSRLARSRSD